MGKNRTILPFFFEIKETGSSVQLPRVLAVSLIAFIADLVLLILLLVIFLVLVIIFVILIIVGFLVFVIVAQSSPQNGGAGGIWPEHLVGPKVSTVLPPVLS